MATTKQNVRMAGARWHALMVRAGRVHSSDNTKLINAFAEVYLSGSVPGLDDALAAMLPRISPRGDLFIKAGSDAPHPAGQPSPVSG